MYPYRFRLSLRIVSPDLDPRKILKALNLKPKWIWKVGEPRTTPDGVPLKGTYEHSYCAFDFSPKKSEDLPAMINRLCDELSKHRGLFTRIRRTGGRVEFFIGIFLEKSNSGEIFDANLLSKLGNLGINLSLDIYDALKETIHNKKRK